MTKLQQLLEQLDQQADNIVFADVMATIDQHYDFTPSAFDNGGIHNAAGENNGSCKVFAFGQLQQLNEQQVLALFGEHYAAVKGNPDGSDHQNIRNFMAHGWAGIKLHAAPLTPR
ncbi:type III effector [Neiella marina]|uniref:Type III effector n=2 Tax=Neiella marina TaxID=508461 RepID=A0A8J2U5T9_9GAMM|nr:HopJ type III effector protein [Neiella marina]GGA79337.1 type III effector [Neiella marina]